MCNNFSSLKYFARTKPNKTKTSKKSNLATHAMNKGHKFQDFDIITFTKYMPREGFSFNIGVNVTLINKVLIIN